MEFVDYKCLESLIIEGEGIIATEGFVDKIKNAWKAIGKFVKPMIHAILKTIGDIGKTIWGCITGLGKKKSNQNELSNDQKRFAITCIDEVSDFTKDAREIIFNLNNLGIDIALLINDLGDKDLPKAINKTNQHMDSIKDLIQELNPKFQKIESIGKLLLPSTLISDYITNLKNELSDIEKMKSSFEKILKAIDDVNYKFERDYTIDTDDAEKYTSSGLEILQRHRTEEGFTRPYDNEKNKPENQGAVNLIHQACNTAIKSCTTVKSVLTKLSQILHNCDIVEM